MIEVRNLIKNYEGFCALKGITFSVPKGQIFGFIGPNGAGKTTTIRILATLCDPTSGDALIGGASVVHQPEEVHRLMGFMPDFFGVVRGLTVREYLEVFAVAYEIPPNKRRQLIRDVLELTDLIYKQEAFVDTLSKGMKQRLCLAKTLVHDPQVLLLDEPAAGLDPRARIELRELLRELQRMGKTIIISSHILSELADFCTVVGIIERGQMLVCDHVENVLKIGQAEEHAAGRVFRMRVLGEPENAIAFLEETKRFEAIELLKGGFVQMKGKIEEEEIPALLSDMLACGLKVVEFSAREAKLEDVFVRVTKGLVQ